MNRNQQGLRGGGFIEVSERYYSSHQMSAKLQQITSMAAGFMVDIYIYIVNGC
jgi:hypothetical protein